ncbi:MAG: MOSC domain-containing protein [Actinomycetota bacterium]|nr:MOSC domain-containing protein [Actinomycetota bacterium]
MPGRGLEGDRYFWGLGTFSDGTDTELTLVEAEAVEALAREHGLDLEPGEARRNVVTRGVRLNALVGEEFRIGEVRLRGVRLAEPCAHLARLVGREALQGLAHRGGLRAEILAGGVLRAGDAVEEEPRCP